MGLSWLESIYCPECLNVFNIGYSHAMSVWCLTHTFAECSRYGESIIIRPPAKGPYVKIPSLWCIKCQYIFGWTSNDKIRIKFTHDKNSQCGESFYYPVAKFIVFL